MLNAFTADDTTTDLAHHVQTSPAVLYVAIGCGVLYLLASAVPNIAKILGPIGRWIQGRSERQRRIAIEHEDAETTTLREDNAYLKGQIDAHRAQDEMRDRLILEHQAWDRDRMSGVPVTTPPPPLFPPARSPQSTTD